MKSTFLIYVQWVIIAALLLALALHTGGGSDDKKAEKTPAVQKEKKPTAPAVAKKQLPSFIGKGLAYAQDESERSGFEKTSSHDATTRQRKQVIDSEWMVCFQSPSSGSVKVTTTIKLGVVKTSEECPANDLGNVRVTKAGQKMPDLTGDSLTLAKQALPSASIDYVDASGKGRPIIIDKNWRVCSSKPAPDEKYAGVPVTLTVTKYGESC